MLAREFQMHELWRERRVFSKAEAWIDILFTVRYSEEPETVQLGFKTMICHRGESLKSIETWAMRWGWSKSKVVRFFGMLKNRNAIETHNETQTTRLVVCNYEAYNKPRNGNGTQVERKPKRTRNAFGTHSETEEESKKVKKDEIKKSIGATPPAVSVFRKYANRYPNKTWYKDIHDTVGTADPDLEFWGEVVHAYIGAGWNPTNVSNMLEFYKAREIPKPGKPTAPKPAAHRIIA